MEPLLVVIVIWLATNFNLHPTERLPQIEFHSADGLSRIWMETVDAERNRTEPTQSARSISTDGVHAFYDDERHIIHLHSNWDSGSPSDVSILVHEMVHHLQNVGGHRHTCGAEREKLAYMAQDSWLRLFGTSVEEQFGVDRMTVLARSTCTP